MALRAILKACVIIYTMQCSNAYYHTEEHQYGYYYDTPPTYYQHHPQAVYTEKHVPNHYSYTVYEDMVFSKHAVPVYSMPRRNLKQYTTDEDEGTYGYYGTYNTDNEDDTNEDYENTDNPTDNPVDIDDPTETHEDIDTNESSPVLVSPSPMYNANSIIDITLTQYIIALLIVAAFIL